MDALGANLAWVESVAAPTWVADPDERIRFVNAGAAELFGRPAEQCIGRTCWELVGACDEEGRSFCSAQCPVRGAARGGGQSAPVTVKVKERWLTLLAIPVWDEEGGLSVVGCALDADKNQRMERYLTRVASRSATVSREQWSQRVASLTRRQREVLDALARDEELRQIASGMHVSLVTVRNHVQHLLPKLGVHSIQEAAALHLLYADAAAGQSDPAQSTGSK